MGRCLRISHAQRGTGSSGGRQGSRGPEIRAGQSGCAGGGHGSRGVRHGPAPRHRVPGSQTCEHPGETPRHPGSGPQAQRFHHTSPGSLAGSRDAGLFQGDPHGNGEWEAAEWAGPTRRLCPSGLLGDARPHPAHCSPPPAAPQNSYTWSLSGPPQPRRPHPVQGPHGAGAGSGAESGPGSSSLNRLWAAQCLEDGPLLPQALWSFLPNCHCPGAVGSVMSSDLAKLRPEGLQSRPGSRWGSEPRWGWERRGPGSRSQLHIRPGQSTLVGSAWSG